MISWYTWDLVYTFMVYTTNTSSDFFMIKHVYFLNYFVNSKTNYFLLGHLIFCCTVNFLWVILSFYLSDYIILIEWLYIILFTPFPRLQHYLSYSNRVLLYESRTFKSSFSFYLFIYFYYYLLLLLL